MKPLRVTGITAEPRSGADIFECCRQAGTLARTQGCPVTFMHNGTTYHVSSEGEVTLHGKKEEIR